MADNVREISCSLKDNNKLVLFGDNIKLNYKYNKENEYMQYALYSPNVDNKDKKVPLIVWLHGAGEVNVRENTFKNRGLPKILNEWKLEGFNAYVLCPRLASDNWNTRKNKNNLYSLIEKIVEDYNIDEKKIIISGHSLGGLGVQQVVYSKQNYFSAMVVMSGDNPYVQLGELKNMPVKGYSESSGNCFQYMSGVFTKVFGKENVTIMKVSHANIPNAAFNEDKNGDGRSDLIEWMLTQELKK